MNVVSTPESPSTVVPASKTSTSPTSHPCTLGLNLPPPPPYTPTVNPNQRRGRSELLQSRQASLPDGVSYGGISPSPPSTQPPSRTTPHRPRSGGSLIRPSCPHETTQDLSHGTRRESISPRTNQTPTTVSSSNPQIYIPVPPESPAAFLVRTRLVRSSQSALHGVNLLGHRKPPPPPPRLKSRIRSSTDTRWFGAANLPYMDVNLLGHRINHHHTTPTQNPAL
ncbi:hypothetical protein BASA60_007312, partial [Batrachochytrium salamandrivorans]